MDISVDHLGGDRFRINVREHQILVDQPAPDGEAEVGPTPTELLVAALAGCTAFYARRGLGRGEGPVALRVRCDHTMSTEPPWRITDLRLTVELPAGTPTGRIAAVQRAIEHCTVANTLADPPRIAMSVAIAAASPEPALTREPAASPR